MTSPIETNNVVERLLCELRSPAKWCCIFRHNDETRHGTTDAPLKAADLIQSLSDRIDVLEGALQLVRRIAKPLIEVDDVWEDSTHIVTAIDNVLTQGGKNV